VSRRLAYPVWMLASVVAAVWLREIAWCVAAGVAGLGLQVVAARAWRTESGALALANMLTLLRLGLVASLPLVLALVPRLAFALLVLGLLVLDGVDGRVARARGEASAFGAALDMETDALTVMVLGLLLHRDGAAGAWVLVAGLWRYAYATAVALVPALGDCPPSRLYRWVFCLLMLALAGAFVPWPGPARVFAALGTVLVSLSFLHSIARSRALRPAPLA
jgi:phosphatidylglycerophosphate synthase